MKTYYEIVNLDGEHKKDLKCNLCRLHGESGFNCFEKHPEKWEELKND